MKSNTSLSREGSALVEGRTLSQPRARAVNSSEGSKPPRER